MEGLAKMANWLEDTLWGVKPKETTELDKAHSFQ